MGTTTTMIATQGAVNASIAAGNSASAARSADQANCRLILQADPRLMAAEQMREYARCVEVINPAPATQEQVASMKIGVATILVFMTIGMIIGFRNLSGFDGVLDMFMFLLFGALAGAICWLFVAGFITAIGFIFS